MASSRPQRVCVFAGSGDGRRPQYREAAGALGRELAERGIGLVYGGSGRGLMGAAADAALAAGGEAVGVIPEGLLGLEQYHRDLTELHIVGSMHERKAKMGDLADAFVALPGGIGTLEELLEVATWSKLGIHAKPCGALNVCGYYDALGALLDAAVEEGFMAPEFRGTVIFDAAPASLLDRTRLATAATLIFVALNLRMAVAAIPPVLTQIQGDTGLGSVGSGLLTALPLFCFGAMASSAPALARRLRMGPLLGLTMAVVAIGCAVRLAPSLLALFLGTAIIGSGIAVANVLLPGLIKRDFRDVAAPMIALYALALSLGATIPAGLTIPIEDLTGLGWRPAVAVWGVVAVIALALWLPRARRHEPAATPRPSPARELHRDRLAWAVTIFMGLQSLCYYAMLSWLPTILESHGMSSGKAGWMLSYMTIPGMAASLVTPAVQRRLPRSEYEVALAALLLATGYVGLIVFGASAPYVWVTALGLGGGLLIALALGYIVSRADDDHHVAHLSTMAQGVGYLIAASGPFVVGALHALTSSWTVPLLVLLVVLVPMLVAGILAGREGHVLAGADLAGVEDLGAEPVS